MTIRYSRVLTVRTVQYEYGSHAAGSTKVRRTRVRYVSESIEFREEIPRWLPLYRQKTVL